MYYKNFTLILITNIFLFFLMLITIQNSSYKQKIKFINIETVPLPISFILGTSFLTGSLFGGLITNIKKSNKN